MRKLLVLFCVFLGGKSMITGEVNMNIWAVGTDDGKSTYEIRRKWGEEGVIQQIKHCLFRHIKTGLL